jgi:hypothetical protein
VTSLHRMAAGHLPLVTAVHWPPTDHLSGADRWSGHAGMIFLALPTRRCEIRSRVLFTFKKKKTIFHPPALRSAQCAGARRRGGLTVKCCVLVKCFTMELPT